MSADRPTRLRRILRIAGKFALALLLLFVIGAASLWLAGRETLGGRAKGDRRVRIERSAQWKDGAFRNRLQRVDGPFGRIVREFLFGGSDHRTPATPVVIVPRTRADYRKQPATGLRVTWLGHSTLLLEIDGRRVLIDPVWGNRASPFTFMGPKRFYPPPLALAELPPLDVVIISHDHYDHLDVETIKVLSARGTHFAVPLGVGAHLESWGVATGRITELDWWESDKAPAFSHGVQHLLQTPLP